MRQHEREINDVVYEMGKGADETEGIGNKGKQHVIPHHIFSPPAILFSH
jgi:hypothetical protein